MDPAFLAELSRNRGGSLDLQGMSRRGIGAPAAPPPITPGRVALEHLINVIPRLGMATRVINAGPVSDGTLDYARSQGWMR